MDDFDAVLSFLLKYESAGNFFEKISLVFSQHNEHRIVPVRLFSLLVYWINGEINFIYLIFIGNVALIGIAFYLFKGGLPRETKLFLFIPVLLILFQPLYYESMYWGMASIQSFYGLLFVVSSFYFLDNLSNKNFIIASLLAICATFTSGNGIFVYPIGIFLLMFRYNTKYAIFWIVQLVALILIYFYSYHNSNPDIAENLKHLLRLFLHAILFLGSMGGNIIISAAILIFIIYLVVSGNFQKNLFLFSVILFIIISAFITSVARSGDGIYQALASRYVIYSSVIICIIYLFSLRIFTSLYDKRIFVFFVLAFSVFINIRSYSISMEVIKHYHNERELARCNEKFDLVYPNSDFAKKIIDKVAEKKMFVLLKHKCKN